jgi:hypothetical protein
MVGGLRTSTLVPSIEGRFPSPARPVRQTLLNLARSLLTGR